MFGEARDDARQPDGTGRELPCRCQISVRREAEPNVLDRQRSRSECDGEAIAREGRDMSEPIADAIDSGISLPMKMPADGTDHGLRLVPERFGV